MENVAEHTGQADEVIIHAGNRLTIETTGELADRIRRELGNAQTVVLEFPPDAELDITAVQVFCAACRTASAQRKNFLYRGPLPGSLIDLAAAAGTERRKPCIQDNKWCFRRFGGEEQCKS